MAANHIDTSNMHIEAMRYQSYLTWPATSPMKPEVLAAAGFFYTGTGDRVECAFCGGHLSHWDEGDQPMTEHRKHYPHCPFVRTLRAGNVPKEPYMLGNEDLDEDAVPGSPPGTRPGFDSPWSIDLDDLRQDVLQNQPAHNPNYSTVESRMETFRTWPSDANQQPEVLASVGFYYSGHNDRVTCFYCGGHLNGWTRGDDPWVEHARWYPRCNFVRIKKGQEYVDLITKRFAGYGTQQVEQNQRVGSSNGGHPLTQPTDEASSSRSGDATVNNNEVAGSATPTSQLVPRKLSATEHSSSSRRIVELTEEESKDINHLLKENRELKEALTCKVCLDREANVVFLPCGHLVCCDSCALPLRTCPLCRRHIAKSVRTYLA